MTSLEFVDMDVRTGDGRSNPLYARIADGLRANPGRWAKWPEVVSGSGVNSLAFRIRKGLVKALADGFQATVRDGILYVRYAGSEAD